MKLNMTTDYAFRTLICLFRMGEGSVVRAEDIASEMKIPINYLQRVIGVLKAEGYIEAVRGQHGGYRLSWTAGGLTAWDIVNLYEPEKIHHSLDDKEGNAAAETKNHPIRVMFRIIQDQMDETLRKTTIQQLSHADDEEVYQMLAGMG